MAAPPTQRPRVEQRVTRRRNSLELPKLGTGCDHSDPSDRGEPSWRGRAVRSIFATNGLAAQLGLDEGETGATGQDPSHHVRLHIDLFSAGPGMQPWKSMARGTERSISLSKRMIRVLAAAFSVAAAWTAVHRLPVTASHAAAPTRCQNIQVDIQPGQINAGAGHVGVQYRILNISQRTCQLYGYPGAVLVSRDFSTLPTHVSRGSAYLGGSPKPRLVVLAPGQSGYFFLEWVHIPSPDQTCPPARYLMITPPNDFLPVFAWAAHGGTITACGGNLVASPVEPKPLF